MKTIGVIGAGIMGNGVAQLFSQNDYSVILIDASEKVLKEARTEIYNNIRFQNLINKNSDVRWDPDKIINSITFTTDYDLLEDAGFVIENATESWEVKKDIYIKIDAICKEGCIFTANTSCISITKIASITKRPEGVIGVHFMNPVSMILAVEMIRGYHTSEATISSVKALLEKVGKECIEVNDYPGFVSNRISHLFMNEAAFVVQDQVASPKEVDDIFKKCYGHKMGPLETADLIGLDTVVNSLDVLYKSYQDSKFRCCPLLRKMVDAGILGRKSGKGFYSY